VTSDERTVMITDQIMGEHEMLSGPVGCLANIVKALGPTDNGSTMLEEVTASLDAVRDNAEQHFDAEERLGLYRQITRQLPQHAEVLRALQREHKTLRSMLDRCQSLARCCQPVDVPFLRARLELFLQYLHLHEVTEDRLMCRARGEVEP